MNVSVVIPTYNERENVRVLIPKIFEVLEKKGVRDRVIVVDDNSPDGTADEVGLMCGSYDIILLRREKKLGIGSAYIAGFKEALKCSDYIFEMDADMSHNPDELTNFIDTLACCDVVIGSRYIDGGRIHNWGVYRILVSRGGNFIARILLGIKVEDITTGYRGYRKDVLSSMDLGSIKSNGYAFQAEILYRVWKNKYKIKEIPIIFRDREAGKSKLSKREIVFFFGLCFKIFFERIGDRAGVE